MDEHIYYQSLARFDKIGPVRLRTLLKTFPSVEAIWSASALELRQAGLGEQVAAEFAAWRRDQNLEKQWEELEKEGIQVITWNDIVPSPQPSPQKGEGVVGASPHPASGHPLPRGEEILKQFPSHHGRGRGEGHYPTLLKEIHDLPYTLFVRGSLPQNDFMLGVVGTRMATHYGRQIVEQIVAPLARAGMVIVSGLALGIDALAHDITVREHGTTLAVLGGGCDRASIYPTSNRGLAERIVESGGALVSEYPPKTLAMPFHFPTRNRIISGMSRGVFVIEAAEDSGSLITAKHALDQNREVFTVPGDITRDTSKGPNNLLKMGAHPVLCAEDILEVLNLQELKATAEARKIVPDDPFEERVLAHMGSDAIHIDELIRATQFDAAKLSSTLTLMEMKGKVRHIGGMHYVLAH